MCIRCAECLFAEIVKLFVILYFEEHLVLIGLIQVQANWFSPGPWPGITRVILPVDTA